MIGEFPLLLADFVHSFNWSAGPLFFCRTGMKVNDIQCLSSKSLQFVFHLMVKCPGRLTERYEIWYEFIHLLIQPILILSNMMC